MCIDMAHSLMLFAIRVVEVMFFSGLVGCASVVVVSWISIFKDGFSDPRETESDSHWESQPTASTRDKSMAASVSLARNRRYKKSALL